MPKPNEADNVTLEAYTKLSQSVAKQIANKAREFAAEIETYKDYWPQGFPPAVVQLYQSNSHLANVLDPPPAPEEPAA